MKPTRNPGQSLRRINCGLCCGILLGCTLLAAGPARADSVTVTGNPVTDQWALQGDSLAPGTFIRETASWDFDVYSSAFTLTAGNPLVNGTTWCVGDQILGMGGVMNGAQPVLPRLVAKFGTTAATFAPASTAAPELPPLSYNYNDTVYGDGVGSLAGAGNGGFMVTYGYQSDYPSYALDPAGQNGAIITPVAGNLYYFTGGVQEELTSGDFGRVIADFQTNGSGQLVTQDNQNGAPSSMPVLQTFEVFLDLSDLSRAGYTQMPSIDGTGDMALQFKTDSYTDGFVGGFASPAGAVPEPSIFALLASALLGLGLVYLRRRGSKA
jgi:hypothetical protein